jgi:hypothetical protein
MKRRRTIAAVAFVWLALTLPAVSLGDEPKASRDPVV